MFTYSLVILSFVVTILAQKNGYEFQDVMQSAETSYPIQGYRVVEKEYYPQQSVNQFSGEFIGGGGGGHLGSGYLGGGPGFIGSGGSGFIGGGGQGLIGGGGQGFIGGAGGGRFIGGGSGKYLGGFYPRGEQFIGGGYGGVGGGYGGGGGGYGSGGFIGGGISPIHHHGIGGQVLDKNEFSEGSKNLKDAGFEEIKGSKGEQLSEGQEGYNHGKVALQNNKGDSGYYNAQEAEKKAAEDGKVYHGAEHFDQEAKTGGEEKHNGYHKKGHTIKGFKSSHHKDEDGKTEEFYDEEHNSGDNNFFDGKSGSFGKNAGSSFKGGHDNGQFNAVENKKQGHYDSNHLVDNSNAGKGEYGQKKFLGNGETYGSQNGVDQHSLLGHQEANKIFKHHPYHVPFYPAY